MLESAPRPRVLIIDDSGVNRQLLRMLITEMGYEAVEAADGSQGLELIRISPPDLILLDILMPGMDGRMVLNTLKTSQSTHRIPVVMISSLDDMAAIVSCIQVGADDYFTRPFDRTLLRARIDVLLERKRLQDSEQAYLQQIQDYTFRLEELVAEQVQQIAGGHVSTIFAMSKLAENRDPETGQHLERMRELCRILAVHMRKRPEYSDYISDRYVDALYAASPMHDIGKVGIPDAILLKPGIHTPEERKVMEQHCRIGAETLRAVYDSHRHNELLHLAIQIAESHHERWDGRGYPYGKAGEEIPLSARILALADVYDALRAQRVYKPALSHEEARVFILNGAGTHFDPAVVDAFLLAEREFIAVHEEWQDGLRHTA